MTSVAKKEKEDKKREAWAALREQSKINQELLRRKLK